MFGNSVWPNLALHKREPVHLLGLVAIMSGAAQRQVVDSVRSTNSEALHMVKLNAATGLAAVSVCVLKCALSAVA